jgi:hypothetical protein
MKTTTINARDLIGEDLVWAVYSLEREDVRVGYAWVRNKVFVGMPPYRAHLTWAFMGPLIEREKISISARPPWAGLAARWVANKDGATFDGPTALIAAARCLVAFGMGPEVDVPEELMCSASR